MPAAGMDVPQTETQAARPSAGTPSSEWGPSPAQDGRLFGGRRRPTTIAAAALLLALVVVAAVAVSLARGLAERSADRHLVLVAEFYELLIRECLEDEREMLSHWSAGASFRALVEAMEGGARDPATTAAMGRMLQDRLHESRYLSLAICASDCSVAAPLVQVGSTGPAGAASAKAEGLLVRAHLAERGSGLVLEAVLDPSHELARLIRRPIDEFDGMLAGLVRLQDDRLIPIGISAGPARELPLHPQDYSDRAAAQADPQRLRYRDDAHGVPHLSRVRPVAGTPWLLVTAMPAERAFAETNRLFLITGALLLPLLGLSVWWGVTMRRQVQARHDLLSQRAAAERRVAELSDRVVVAQELECRRIIGQLHDETGASLATLQINLKTLARRLDPGDSDNQGLLEESSELLLQTVAGLRTFTAGLRPAELEYGGLRAAIQAEAERLVRRFGLHVQLDLVAYRSTPPQATETTVFRVVQEALQNCAKHAGARLARVRLANEGDGSLVAEVVDDGQGFDVEALRSRSGGHGQGLLIMRERAASVGGRLIVERAGAGSGMRVCLSIPIP